MSIFMSVFIAIGIWSLAGLVAVLLVEPMIRRHIRREAQPAEKPTKPENTILKYEISSIIVVEELPTELNEITRKCIAGHVAFMLLGEYMTILKSDRVFAQIMICIPRISNHMIKYTIERYDIYSVVVPVTEVWSHEYLNCVGHVHCPRIPTQSESDLGSDFSASAYLDALSKWYDMDIIIPVDNPELYGGVLIETLPDSITNAIARKANTWAGGDKDTPLWFTSLSQPLYRVTKKEAEKLST